MISFFSNYNGVKYQVTPNYEETGFKGCTYKNKKKDEEFKGRTADEVFRKIKKHINKMNGENNEKQGRDPEGDNNI